MGAFEEFRKETNWTPKNALVRLYKHTLVINDLERKTDDLLNQVTALLSSETRGRRSSRPSASRRPSLGAENTRMRRVLGTVANALAELSDGLHTQRFLEVASRREIELLFAYSWRSYYKTVKDRKRGGQAKRGKLATSTRFAQGLSVIIRSLPEVSMGEDMSALDYLAAGFLQPHLYFLTMGLISETQLALAGEKPLTKFQELFYPKLRAIARAADVKTIMVIASPTGKARSAVLVINDKNVSLRHFVTRVFKLIKQVP